MIFHGFQGISRVWGFRLRGLVSIVHVWGGSSMTGRDSKSCSDTFYMSGKVLGIILCHPSAFWRPQIDFKKNRPKKCYFFNKRSFGSTSFVTGLIWPFIFAPTFSGPDHRTAWCGHHLAFHLALQGAGAGGEASPALPSLSRDSRVLPAVWNGSLHFSWALNCAQPDIGLIINHWFRLCLWIWLTKPNSKFDD